MLSPRLEFDVLLRKCSSWRSVTLLWHRQSWFLFIYTAEFKCSNWYCNIPVIIVWYRRKNHKLSTFLLPLCYCSSCSLAVHSQKQLLGVANLGSCERKGKWGNMTNPWQQWRFTEPLKWVISCGYSAPRGELRYLVSSRPVALLFWQQPEAREKSPCLWSNSSSQIWRSQRSQWEARINLPSASHGRRSWKLDSTWNREDIFASEGKWKKKLHSSIYISYNKYGFWRHRFWNLESFHSIKVRRK